MRWSQSIDKVLRTLPMDFYCGKKCRLRILATANESPNLISLWGIFESPTPPDRFVDAETAAVMRRSDAAVVFVPDSGADDGAHTTETQKRSKPPSKPRCPCLYRHTYGARRPDGAMIHLKLHSGSAKRSAYARMVRLIASATRIRSAMPGVRMASPGSLAVCSRQKRGGSMNVLLRQSAPSACSATRSLPL